MPTPGDPGHAVDLHAPLAPIMPTREGGVEPQIAGLRCSALVAPAPRPAVPGRARGPAPPRYRWARWSTPRP